MDAGGVTVAGVGMGRVYPEGLEGFVSEFDTRKSSTPPGRFVFHLISANGRLPARARAEYGSSCGVRARNSRARVS